MKPKNHIESAMQHHNILLVVCLVLVVFGFYCLPNLNKDEFPQFTIRQGVVAAIYPGASAQEVEEQVAKPLERFLFTFQEVDKGHTYSVSENGIVYIFAELKPTINDKDAAWSKIRHGLKLFKTTSLPAGVLEVVVIDDFGNTSSMLLAVESEQRTPRELEKYAEQICDRLRTIPEMGNLKTLGLQREEIAVIIDDKKLSAYGIDQKMLFAELATQGFRTMGASIEDVNGNTQIHVSVPYDSEYAIGEQIVFTDASANSIRLRDVAKIERRYAKPSSFIEYEGKSAVIISIEMCAGNNIVAFGDEVEKILKQTQELFPPDINVHRITDQPKLVDKSVISFLRDLVNSMIVVIAVMLLLFPLRTALVAGSGVPICTAITLALMYMFNIELNTVTLAALIVVLGMIVDNSIIMIDGYSDYIQKGYSRWYSASVSAKELFVPTLLATIAICAMFFPMVKIITGPLGDFVQLFPWTILFALIISLFYAVWVIPYLSTKFIRKSSDKDDNFFERMQNRFFVRLQDAFDKFLKLCFRYPKMVILSFFLTLALGLFLFTRLNVQMLPKAERDCFAVEIHLTEGSLLAETELVADSVSNILRSDDRVKSVTSFVGCASPRFHATYAPEMAKKSYAQLIVNTVSEKATIDLLKEYGPKYRNHFPNAYVRFKQMDYQVVKNPVEVRFTGDDLAVMEVYADSLKRFLNSQPELTWVHSNYDESTPNIKINLKPDESSQLGITQTMLSLYLSGALGGQPLTSIWENDYKIPVVLYSQMPDTCHASSLNDQLVPTALPGVWVPLAQVADIEPHWEKSSITRYNSIRTITVGCDLDFGCSQPASMKKVVDYVEKNIKPNLPPEISVDYA
ncbi:MAG: efflux RND transporter permease subunit, partial [Bacteroidales bacterium]|nr:efflux RND transporter permease subunit [Bacteroidales bacterium]